MMAVGRCCSKMKYDIKLFDEDESNESYTAASCGIFPSSIICTITEEDVRVEGAHV